MFSNKELKKYLLERPWDHQIKLKLGAPATLISKTILLSVTEQQKLEKIINEHLEQEMIQRNDPKVQMPLHCSLLHKEEEQKATTHTEL